MFDKRDDIRASADTEVADETWSKNRDSSKLTFSCLSL